jgi:glycerophosphoryl diester phosphodiesterase
MLFKTNTVIGHRGCADFDQNNTVEAFEKALADGAEMVELDVRKTRDDVMVVWHDIAIGSQRIRGNNYADLLTVAHQGGFVLPKLEDVLKKLEGRGQLVVELKEAGYEEEVMGLLLKYFTPSEMVVMSFLDQVVGKIKKHFPTVKVGLLLGASMRDGEYSWKGWRKATQRLSEFFPWVRMRQCQADFLAANWKISILGLARAAFKKGIPIFVWTVNDSGKITKLMKSRLYNGIITDKTALAVKIRNNL